MAQQPHAKLAGAGGSGVVRAGMQERGLKLVPGTGRRGGGQLQGASP